MSNYELFVALRYFRSPRKDHSISVITWVSMIGVALGVAALIIAISLMNGFRDNLQRSIIGSLPHVNIYGVIDNIVDSPQMNQQILEHEGVLAVSPYIVKQTLLMAEQESIGTLIRGIDPVRELSVTDIALFVRQSLRLSDELDEDQQLVIATKIVHSLKQGGIILGARIARKLNVNTGDFLKLVSSHERITPLGNLPRLKKIKVIGIFESGISGYDETLSFVDYRLIQKLYQIPNYISGLGIRIENVEKAPEIAQQLQKSFPRYITSNWASDNQSIFQVMKLEKVGLFLLLSLIIVIVSFNILSSLTMMVLEKSKEIAILKSIGATDRSIGMIFMLQGALIGWIGAMSGLLLGLLAAWILMNFQVIEVPVGVYPGGGKIPMAVYFDEVAWIVLSAFFICFFATLYPANKAARILPAESLRYE